MEATKRVLKPDRKMSPLNPLKAVKDSESPPVSPSTAIPPFSDEFFKKRSIGLSLRRLATENVVEKPEVVEPKFKDTASKRLLGEKKGNRNDTTVALLDLKYLDEPRSHLLFRSASLTDLPKWAQTPRKNLESIHEDDIGLEEELSRTDRLTQLAGSFSAWEIYAFTSHIETSRRAKNYLWRSKPIGVWPDWHEGLQTQAIASPLPSFAEIPYQNKPVRIPSRTKTKSPNRDLDDDDSDVSHSSSRYSHRNKITSNFIRNPLSISTRDGNLSDHEQRFTRNLSDNEQRSGRSLEAEDRKDKSTTRSQDGSVTRSEQDREFRFVRSYSDGDLTDYLKGFSDLKASLSMAQITCNSEIRKILDDLQLNFQKSLDEKIEPKVTKVRNKSKPLLRVDIVKTNKPFVKSPLSPNSAMISPNYQQKQLEDAIKTMKPDLALRGSDSKKIDKVDLGETSPLLDALLQVIAIAQNILDLSLTQVMAPNVVSSIIQQLQQMQFLWRKNPTWQLHDLVLRLLIVFSSVARIMEYFEQDLRNWVDLKEEHGRPVQRKLKNISSLSSLRSGFSESEDNNDSEYSHDSPHRRKKYTPNLLSFSETSKNTKAFRDAVDEDQNLNVLIELSQSGICTYVSQSCAKLFQYSPAQIVGQSIIPFLIDKNVFLEACKETKLDSVQIQFWCKRLDGRTVKMEGKGLIKREDDSSIWIIRPLKVSRGVDSPNLLPAVIPEIKTDKTEIPNIDLALCSICENSVPALMFKIHTEACLKIHRTEMDLVLLNDEIKKEILKCENNDVILKSEIKTVDKELKVVHFDENKTGYMEYLANLSIINVEILTKLKKLKLSMAKEDEMVEFKCGNEKLYIQNLDDDPGIQELGHGVYICGKTLQEYISQKKILLKKLWEESSTFQEMLSQELSLMQEIQKQSNLITEDEYQKFETKEIGGVIVRIPSIAPEKKESLFFQEESRSRYSSDSSLGSQEEEPKKALKRKQKHNILRVNVSEVQRRPSLRSSRMLVGDKTLEIEPGSPLLNSRHSSFSFLNINRPLASPIAPTPTIKEYEIIKPISKGAFGSVFLAKKKISGDYFAIKVLKKSDMVAKNQAMNIKSERTILTQIDSPYIVKLFSTFQSKDRIFLVMEYLNGGDCASLLKSFGNLDETWAKQYITEMIQGLEFLHHKDIVHRDLKPDNMLIDSNGHIKLTDFGLSKAGFLGRRAIGVGGDSIIPVPSPTQFKNSLLGTGRKGSMASISSNDSSCQRGRIAEKLEAAKEKKLVGTPDYIAPESILGLGQGFSVDWWAVGVILYEFLNGFPPFNADTLPEVFENIIMRRIKWDDDVCSPEAREIMERLMCTEVEMRLGARGALEVKQMKWLSGTYWDNLMSQKVHFIPTVKDIEDTDYFDNRGSEIEGKLSDSDEDLPPIGHDYSSGYFSISEEKALDDDFGEVVYKNMSLLEKQNQMTASKISLNNVGGDQWLQKRRDSLPISNLHPLNPILLSKSPLHSPNRTMLPKSSPPRISSNRRDSLPMINSQELDTPESRSSAESITETTDDKSKTSQESLISTPKAHKKNSQAYLDDAKRSLFGLKEAEKEAEIPKSDTLDILIAEQNPITSKIIETILQNQSARTIVVRNGAEAIQCLMGDIKYDVCIISSHIQVVSSEQVSKMIRTTKGMNFSTPLVLIGEGYSGMGFDHLLTMPITKEGVLAALESVGILEDKENNTE